MKNYKSKSCISVRAWHASFFRVMASSEKYMEKEDVVILILHDIQRSTQKKGITVRSAAPQTTLWGGPGLRIEPGINREIYRRKE